MKKFLILQLVFTLITVPLLLVLIVDAILKTSSLYYIAYLVMVLLFLYFFIRQLIKDFKE
ncbi:MAG: hypothetical protein LIO93_08980 [Bacteroidales bacterium]|nr:hypothetical protein [Bacteroidales bacterium]